MSIANANSDSKFLQIYKFVAELEDKDTAIRATDQNLSKAELKKEKNKYFDQNRGATHLYVRSGFFSKLRQVLTSGTDGAIKKQKMAKDLIIDALESLPKDLQKESYVKVAFDNIKETLNSHDGKDITAKMIKGDLTTIFNELEKINKATKINNINVTQAKLNAPVKNDASVSVVAESPTVKKTVLPDGAEESIDSKAKKERIQASDSDLLSMVKLNPLPDLMHFSGLANMQKLNALPNLEAIISQVKNTDTQQADSPPPNLSDSIGVAEVVLNSLDPVLNGKPSEETNSSLEDDEIQDGDDELSEVESGSDSDDEDGAVSSSESGSPTQKTSTLQSELEELQQQPIDILLMGQTLKVVTIKKYESESTPSPAPTARTSTAETKSNETANRYLESLKSKWSANENGYFEVSNPFYITSEMPTSKMLAQAYLLPEGKQLEFFGKKGEPSKLSGNRIMHGEHELRDDLDLTNEKRGTRPYLKLEVKLETKSFQSSTKVAQNPAVLRLAEKYKNSLITKYIDSIKKISDEYKKTNPGKELETLVIAPITSTEGILLEVETAALVSALKEIQLGNPGLKIAISPDKESHSDALRAAYEK